MDESGSVASQVGFSIIVAISEYLSIPRDDRQLIDQTTRLRSVFIGITSKKLSLISNYRQKCKEFLEKSAIFYKF
jgi:hypothetical protein